MQVKKIDFENSSKIILESDSLQIKGILCDL